MNRTPRTLVHTAAVIGTIGCLAGLSVLSLGCSGDSGATCALVNITRLSDDANNTEEFSPFEGTQCDVVIGDGTMSIDILDRSTGDTNPRVLFTLAVTGDEIPTSAEIDLTRVNDTDLPPALYQEYIGDLPPDFETADGPFWSSLDDNGGTIVFSLDELGNVVAAFDFTADNPVEVGNTAQGVLQVIGTVTVQTVTAESCGGTGATAMILMMVGLAFMRGRRKFGNWF